MRLLPCLEAALRMKKTLILLFALLLCCLVPSAFAQDVTISGCAYVDANGNAVADNDESRMSGVPVTLERSVEDGWETVQQAVTDEYGWLWSFPKSKLISELFQNT